MNKKGFYFYLEKVRETENIVIKKINEIIDFREEIKDNKIIKESFTFLHYPEGLDFNPITFTNNESTMSGKYVSNLQELKKIIIEQNLYSENNSISFEIEYLDKDLIIKKIFSTEKYLNETNDKKEDELKINSLSKVKRITDNEETYEKNIASY